MGNDSGGQGSRRLNNTVDMVPILDKIPIQVPLYAARCIHIANDGHMANQSRMLSNATC